jgi:ABC-type Fe3+/spermidine/putrescine transport system ATPase subunit
VSAFLRVDGLRLRLGDFALGALSFQLERGEALVVLGPSGCGKTTLLRCLAGILDPDGGAITLDGRDLTALPPQRRAVGYVPQTAMLFPHLDVRANVAFGLRYVDASETERRRRFETVAELLRIGPLLERRVATLSGGEGKRVALARSLVLEPSLLALDEPLGMLDHNAREGMLEALRDVAAATQTTTIHVTHDREEAWRLKGRCAVMDRGRLCQVGPIEDVFRRPETRFVAEFLGGENVLEAAFVAGEDGPEADLGWARLPLARPVDAPAGLVVIRPETLAVAADPADADLRGTLLDRTDRGAYASLRVRVGASVDLVAHVPASDAGGLTISGKVGLRCREPVQPLSGGGNDG